MTRMVPFGDIAKETNRLIDVHDDVEYACGGVRLHGRGVFIREYKQGTDIKKKFVQHVLKEGDIVYSTLFAKSGAFALADKSVDGAVLSEKFPTFTLETELVRPDYLKWLFRSGQLNRIAEEQMTGVAAFSLAHLSKKKFLQLKIPVPSVDRQCEVIRLCEAAAARSEGGLVPVDSSLPVLQALVGAASSKLFSDFPRKRMAEIGDYVLRNATIQSGVSYKQITVAMNGRGLRLRRICDGSEIKSPGQAFVQEGDMLFSRIDIRQGAIGFVSKELEGAVVTRDFPVFRLHRTDPVDISFLRYVFTTGEFMTQAKEASRGTTGRKKMKRPAFLELTLPWPTEQERAAAVQVAARTEAHVSALINLYKRQRALIKGLGHSAIATLFAKDAGLL